MRSIPGALQTEIDAGRITKLVRIVLKNGAEIGLTSWDKPLTVAGLQYNPAPGIVSGAWNTREGVSVDSQQLRSGWLTAPEEDLLEGLYDDAYTEFAIAGYANPGAGRLVLFAADLGQLSWDRDGFSAEALDVMRVLGNPLGRTFGPGCPVDLGSQGAGLCNVNLTTYEVSMTVTAVDGSNPRLVFSDSALTQADGWFADGLITWNTGANAGRTQTIELHAADQFTLQLPARYAISIGDTAIATPGCDKTYGAGGCAKFSNQINFQGWPFLREETEIP